MYYEVVAKCGHVGKGHCILITFSVEAENGKEAARIVRQFPRVKHDHKDAIVSVKKIDEERFLEIKEINHSDPYLLCKSRWEQNLCDIEDRIIEDNNIRKGVKKEIDFVKKNKKLIRNYKKYMKYNYIYQDI